MAKEIIHLSDGEKAVCGAKSKKAVSDENNFNCPKCHKWLEEQAQKKKDPLIWCRIIHREIDEGIDWQFTFEGKLYHLVNGAVRKIPRSVINHLRSLHYPVIKLKQGEAGGTVKSFGSYHKVMVQELNDEEVAQMKLTG